ncbi:hypothetical protein [Allorhizobium taibaishanense]|uniref:Sorbitol-specific phosphotransferase system component IIC n=1 Tax=Allorhizobium taibaishanense TaxID=887144 RepID=A0A1Q9A130_9HYPH|nr:hypothetical protein [Allorhizobium taibaishanense]MBB4007958.1 sorbitol-specific phosphotransferase system component IIC [Allorhizobium taibaishanense]OLP48275.1 hypothetical protein BJF91_09080 [Allorhizobium taibaishanense]
MKALFTILTSLVLTIPMAILIGKFTPLGNFLFSEAGYRLLDPLFELFGSIGAEDHIDIISSLILLIGLLTSLIVTLIAAKMIFRTRGK